MLLHQCSLSETAEREVGSVLWASISPPEEIPSSLGWLVKLDRTSGKIWDTSTFRVTGEGMRSNSARPLASRSTVRHLQLVLDIYGVAQTNTDPDEAFPRLRLERRITLPHRFWTEDPLVLDRTPIGILLLFDNGHQTLQSGIRYSGFVKDVYFFQRDLSIAIRHETCISFSTFRESWTSPRLPKEWRTP